MNKRRRFRIIARTVTYGVRDGWEQPFDFTSGRTFGDVRDVLYDYGVNIGQALSAITIISGARR